MPDTDDRPVACCRSCGDPLIATFAFRGYEFYCLECGAHFGFLEPIAEPLTEELWVRHDHLRAEWEQNAGDRLIADGGRRRDCEACHGEEHRAHATQDEVLAHAAALAWLARRAQQVGGR